MGLNSFLDTLAWFPRLLLLIVGSTCRLMGFFASSHFIGAWVNNFSHMGEFFLDGTVAVRGKLPCFDA